MAAGREVGEEDASALIESSPMESAALRLTLKVDEDEGSEGHFKRLLDAAEKEILETELGRADWNVSQAARNLGIDRANLHRKMRRLGIERGTGGGSG
jgi:transcriptional regulator of acetoin/glycerol metabolism